MTTPTSATAAVARTAAPAPAASGPGPGGAEVGTVSGGTPAAAPTPASTGQGRVGGLVASARAALEKTPGRMRALAVLGVLVALLFGLAAGQAFRAADGALVRAGDNTDQLVRIQGIQTSLVEADADATNAFLVGGLEPAAQRADYTAAMATASRLIAEAAQHQPADGRALGALNTAVVRYASEIERARADNRLGLPLGAQYLKDASANLRSDALPVLANLVKANEQRVVAEFDGAGRAALWVVVAGLLALMVVALELVWLARRTKRYLNLPLAAGGAVVFVTLILGVLVLAGVARTVDDVRSGVYAATLSVAKARIAGFDAKSNESLTLIARGSGAAFEKAWQASDAAVKAEIAHLADNPASSGEPTLPWAAYETVHKQIRALDDSGKWDEAVKLATGTGPNTGNGSFQAYDKASAGQLSDLSGQTASRLDDAGVLLPFAGILGLLAGLLAAALVWYGFSQRLEEYR